MSPLDYEEFRWAMGDTASIPLLKQFFDKRLMLGQAHRTKMRELRLYMLVGGMPQAVNEYLETNNLSMVDLIKRDIIRLYLDDFVFYLQLAEYLYYMCLLRNLPQVAEELCRRHYQLAIIIFIKN